MDNIRIAVLSAYDDVRAFLDNEAPESMHYYDDELHEYLKGAASTYTFKTDAQHPESVNLVEGNKLAFKWRRKDYYFNIVRVIRDEYEVEVEAYSLNLELLNERVDAYKAANAMSFAAYLDVFDYENVLTLNINEVADKAITNEWTGSDTVLARIYSLATVFDAEVEFIPQLNNDYSLKKIVLNVYKKHSSTDQGLGRYRQDIVLRYGNEVSGITKTSDIIELYTAIRPTGKDGLMVTSLNKTENDAAGNVEYQSLTGDGCIRAVQARDRFPSNTASTDRYSTVDWSYDTDNVNTLYGQALAELKKNCVPQVQYEVEGYFDTDIGDTVTIVDEVYNPPLYLQARVTEQFRSFTDPAQNKTTFDNFKELQSQIDAALMRAMQQLIEENKVYTCSILTNNGIVFKNGEGTTTLNASVMDAGKDMTGSLTIKWYKDGVAVGTSGSLLVSASDISNKAVYRFEALEGAKIRGTYEVTVTNVADGTDGQTGPPGETGPKGDTGEKGDNGDRGETGVIVSDTAPENPTVGQLWQTATKQPIKRWDGTAWVLHYISVDNLDVETLSALSANLGTVIAGLIKNTKQTVTIDVSNGIISSVSENGDNFSLTGGAGYMGIKLDNGSFVVAMDDDRKLNSPNEYTKVESSGISIMTGTGKRINIGASQIDEGNVEIVIDNRNILEELNTLNSNLNSSTETYSGTYKGLAITVRRVGAMKQLKITGTLTGDLATSSALVQLCDVGSSIFDYSTIKYVALGTGKAQLSVTSAGLIRIGYSRDNAGALADISSGSSVNICETLL